MTEVEDKNYNKERRRNERYDMISEIKNLRKMKI